MRFGLGVLSVLAAFALDHVFLTEAEERPDTARHLFEPVVVGALRDRAIRRVSLAYRHRTCFEPVLSSKEEDRHGCHLTHREPTFALLDLIPGGRRFVAGFDAIHPGGSLSSVRRGGSVGRFEERGA